MQIIKLLKLTLFGSFDILVYNISAIWLTNWWILRTSLPELLTNNFSVEYGKELSRDAQETDKFRIFL